MKYIKSHLDVYNF